MKFNPGKYFPPGHFYSPIVDLDFVKKYEEIIWPSQGDENILGIDMNREGQIELLDTRFSEYLKDFDYPMECPDQSGYYQSNGMFSGLDARALFVMLRTFSPKNIIEIGSGFSSLLTMNVNCRFLDSQVDVQMIEPYPPTFLEPMVKKHGTTLHKVAVQDVPIEMFGRLKENDILFIDSAHVAKMGSDVNHLFFNVLPRLSPGVVVHMHDIFLPDEYPKNWIFEENRSWNEQYLLRAFLMFNASFKVLFGCHYAASRLKEHVIGACGANYGGGSFWMQKISY